MSREAELEAALRGAVTYLEALGGENVVIAQRYAGLLRGRDLRSEAAQTVIVDGVLYNADAQVAVMVCEMLDMSPMMVPFKGLGLVENDKLVGGALFLNQIPGRDIEAYVAIDRTVPVSKRSARKILEYPFGQLGLPRVTLQIEMSNEHAIRIAKGYGAKLEGVKEGANIGIFGLLPKNCPFWG